MITNLCQRSHFSVMDGCSTCEQIARRCKELGMGSVCLSDDGNVMGHLSMMDAAAANGLMPILGIEVDVAAPVGEPAHVCLWATDTPSLHELWGISSAAWLATHDGARVPVVTGDMLDGHASGIVATTTSRSFVAIAAQSRDEAMASAWIDWATSTFKDVFIGLSTGTEPEARGTNLWLSGLASRVRAKVIYSMDARYALEPDADFHDVWYGMGQRSCYNKPHARLPHDRYIQSEDAVRARLAYLGADVVDACVSNGEAFVAMFSGYDLDDAHKVPSFDVPDGWSDPDAYLRDEVMRGIMRKAAGMDVPPSSEASPLVETCADALSSPALSAYVSQVEGEELPIILRHHLTDFFLVVSDYMRWCKSQGILCGPGRGSCVASIVCYALDITECDPVGKGLYFSRFLNEGRMKHLPDIDVDIPMDRLDDLHDYLRRRYGQQKVAAVGLFLFYGWKLAIRDICRYYAIPLPDAGHLSRVFNELEAMGGDWHDHLPDVSPDDAAFVSGYESRYPDMFAYAGRMVGLMRQPGKHAAGYILSPSDLAPIMPLRKSRNDEVITQFDKWSVDRMGFLKADLLGLRNLTTISKAIDAVERSGGGRIDPYALSVPPDDTTWSLFDKGDTLGVFQCDGAGLTRLLQDLHVRSVEDVSTAIALYRPGVLNARTEDGTPMLDEYVARAKGERPVRYDDPHEEAALSRTYGIAVFQEQTIQLLMDMAGFTAEQADMVRAAIGKKKLDQIQAARPRFLEGCEANGIATDVASHVFDNIEASGSYSFNCVTGDTVVMRADGTWVSVKKLYGCYGGNVRLMSLCRDGAFRSNKLKAVVVMGMRNTFRVTTTDGCEMTATADHRILTTRGYMRVGELIDGERILVCHGPRVTVSELESVKPAGQQMTYDLEMRDFTRPNFVAGGIVTHNCGHSLAYATIAVWTAWLKAHHFGEYVAACMSTVTPEKAVLYRREAKARGWRMVAPTVRDPHGDYAVVGEREISVGLSNVAGLGERTVRSIEDNAPYAGFTDFVDRSGCNAAAVESLISIGFFRDVYANSNDLMLRYRSNDYRPTLWAGELGSFRTTSPAPMQTDVEVEEAERCVLGEPVSVDPFDRFRAMSRGVTLCDAAMLSRAHDGATGTVLAHYEGHRNHITKSRRQMAFESILLDSGDLIECTVFPDTYKELGGSFPAYALYVLKKQTWNGRPSYSVVSMKPLEA